MNKHKAYFFYFLTIIIFIIGCKREHKVVNSIEESQNKIETILSDDIKKVSKMKVSSKKVVLNDNYSVSIPQEYDFEEKIYTVENYLEDFKENALIKLAKANETKNITWLSFYTIFGDRGEIATQDLFIFSTSSASNFTIEDLKNETAYISKIYYEDETSIIFEDDSESYHCFSITYDETRHKNLIYTAEISWSKKYLKKDKLDYLVYLLQVSKKFKNQISIEYQYTNWNDYVANKPKLEIDPFTKMLANFEKEIIYFADNKEIIAPRTDENYGLLSLYRSSKEDEVLIESFIEKKGFYDFSGNLYSFFGNYEYSNYSISQNNSIYIIQKENKYDDEIKFTYSVFAKINYKDKTFYIKPSDEIQKLQIDFYAKMFENFTQKINELK